MSETQTITVQDVMVREGAKDGRAWKKWGVKDGNGAVYSTFSQTVGEAAVGLVGKRATITFNVSGDRGQFNDLLTIEPEAEAPATSSRGEDDDVDWERIGLLKTRCLLWAAFIRAHGSATSSMEVEAFIGVGARVVAGAEWDIYNRKALEPADPDDPNVPF